MNVIEAGALYVFAAMVIESIAEYFVAPWFDLLRGKMADTLRVQLMRWACGGVAVFAAYELGLDIFTLLGTQMRHAWAAWLLTGLVVGRGSNVVHALVEWVQALAAKKGVEALMARQEWRELVARG